MILLAQKYVPYIFSRVILFINRSAVYWSNNVLNWLCSSTYTGKIVQYTGATIQYTGAAVPGENVQYSTVYTEAAVC